MASTFYTHKETIKMNTAYSLAGKFVITSALLLTVFVAYIITNAAANNAFIPYGNGDFRLVQEQQHG